MKQGAGVQNIEITDKNVKSFERVARKYGVDFALKKDPAAGKYLVFFKARDADALNAAFAVYAVDGNQKVAGLITGADGVAELSLEPGSYYLKEQRAPEGFRLETARILFTITADTKTNVEVTNEKEGVPTPAPSKP